MRYRSARNGIRRRRTSLSGERVARSGKRGSTPLPSSFEQPQTSAGRRMRAACLAIEPHAEAWPVRPIEAAVRRRDDRRVIDELLHPWIGEVVEVLEPV